MNEAQVIVTGNVANKPSLGTTPAGVSVANMRLGYTPRRLDRESGQWVDGQTSWLTVKCWRKLADHVAMSLNKGDPVVVKGVLQVRPFTDKDGNPRLGVEVLASAVGHDLTRGVTNFMRTGRKSGALPLGSQDEPEAGVSSQAGGDRAEAEADGEAASVPSGSPMSWDPSREELAEDADAGILDETAVVAAALHAVPDLGAGAGVGHETGRPRSGTGSRSDASVTVTDSRPGDGRHNGRQPTEGQPGHRQPTEGQPGHRQPSEEQAREGQGSGATGRKPAGEPEGNAASAPAGDVPAGRNQAEFPAQRKAGARPQRRAGAADGTSRVKEPSLT